MTTLQDDATIDHEIAIELTPIPTDLDEAFTIKDLREMTDLVDRARTSAAVARETEEQGDAARHLRDVGALLMIQPFQAAQRPYDAEIERIDAALEAGKIKPAQVRDLKRVASVTRRKAMEGVVYNPIDVYQTTIGVSRGLFIRMQHREPQLPSPEEYLDEACNGDPRIGQVIAEVLADEDNDILDAVAAVAKIMRQDCTVYDAINKESRLIRDAAIRKLARGNKREKRQRMTNADLARLTQLTTPRIAQIKAKSR